MRIAAATLALCAIAACDDEARARRALVADPTAFDQSDDARDLSLVAAVRRDLVADPLLSLSGKNVVVVVRDGVATLRGDVADRAEHERVVARVVSVPGVVRVDDRLGEEP